MLTLKGKTTLITGAAGGIGIATARLFAEHEAEALYLTDVRKENLEKVVKEIERTYPACKCYYKAGDICVEAEDIALVADAVARMGRLDILANIAGISRQGDIYSLTETQWDMMFNINVKGMFFLSREAIKVMAAAKSGAIVNLASQAGRQGGIVVAPDYASSKGAVLTLTKSLAKVGAKDNVRVNSISPGLIATEMTADFGYDPKTVPLGRIGTAEDVAKTILFLASDYAGYVTGASLDVNGGVLML